MIKRIQEIDRNLSETIRKAPLPVWCYGTFKVFVRFGDGWVWLPVLLAIFLSKPLNDFWVITGHCLMALAVSLAFYWPLKLGVRRLRPFQMLSGVTAGVSPLDRFSFPSGHTMHNLALGLTVGHYFPLSGWVLAAIPVAFGGGRIFFGVHFLGDIVVGAALGVCSFQLATWFFLT